MSSLNTLFPGLPPKFEPHITITTNISLDLADQSKTKDDVDRILSASAVAMNSLPKNHESLVKLGNVNSQRKFFKKLYFEVEKDPNLVSFARIIRELFVIVPQDIEKENIKQNPQLYTKDNNGNTIRRKPLKRKVKQLKSKSLIHPSFDKQLHTRQQSGQYKNLILISHWFTVIYGHYTVPYGETSIHEYWI